MNAEIRQASLLKKIIEAVKDLITEANLDCDENGIYLQAMDSSHVSLVTFFLKNNLFERYNCEKSLSLGVNIISMAKILKCALNDDVLILETSDLSDTLNFRFESIRGHKLSSFELRLMNLDIERLSIPDTEYSCIIEMTCAEFSKVCHDLFTIGDSIQLTCGKKGINFITYGDLGTGNIQLKLGSKIDNNDEDAYAIKINISKPLSLTFSLRYLIYFTKASSLSETVVLSMGEEVPLSKTIFNILII